MGTITVRMSDEDSAILANLAKERATAGETILAGVVTMLLLATASLAAPVVPVKVTVVVVSSAPPWVPGAV